MNHDFRSSLTERTNLRTPRARRGSVVLLALTAVAVATLLGLSLAASRDATIATSTNLAKAAAARAAASGGIELAIELLNDPSRAVDSHGVLFNTLLIGDASARATVVDLATGRPPDEHASAIEITVVAVAGGVTQTARAVGRMPSAEGASAVDLDCSEFAVLASESLVVEADALVGLWSRAPLAALREPVCYGMTSGSRSGLLVDPRAVTHGCVQLRQGDFALTSDAMDSNLADKVRLIPADIHVPDAMNPPVAETFTASALTLDGLVTSDASVSGDARVPARSSVTLRAVGQIEIAGNLHVEHGALLRVEGNTTIIVRGNAVFDSCAIEVAHDGLLTVIASGDVTMAAAYLGGEREDPLEGRDASGDARYDGGASKVSIYVTDDSRVCLCDATVLKGEIYAPRGRLSVETRSAVYGRVLANEVRLKAGTALFFDPALDQQRGWSAHASGVWSDAHSAHPLVHPLVREVASLDPEHLGAFAEAALLVPDMRERVGAKNDSNAQNRRARVDFQVGLARAQSRANAQARERLEFRAMRNFYSLGFAAAHNGGDE